MGRGASTTSRSCGSVTSSFTARACSSRRSLSVPSVLFVPAPLMWEAKQWGVARPGWHHALERGGEVPAVRGADLVACGTEHVAQQVRRMGVTEEHILVTPTGADLDAFAGSREPRRIRQRLGLDDRFVIGWVGSFRRFHALEVAVAAAAQLEGVTLLLVGDGPDRPRIEKMADDAGVTLVTTGTVPHADIPDLLAAMDVALVLGAQHHVFHYSPLKLAEYLAAGLPVVVPDVPQIASRLVDEADAMIIPLGDVESLARALVRVRDEPALRGRLSSGARIAARQWSWDRQIERILATLS